MAYALISNEYTGDLTRFRNEFVIDSTADVAGLPPSAPGSVAVVADKDGPVFMVNASGEWKEQ